MVDQLLTMTYPPHKFVPSALETPGGMMLCLDCRCRQDDSDRHPDQGLDNVIAELRRKLTEGMTIYTAAKSLVREGWTGLTQTTLLIHAQDIQRELWVEQGVSTTKLVEGLARDGHVTIVSDGNAYLIREVQRMAEESGLAVEKVVMLRLKSMRGEDLHVR